MRIRIIDTTIDEKTSATHLESPAFGLELGESVTPNWTKTLIKQDTWQGHQFSLAQLSQLLENLPEHALSTKERIDATTCWTMGENTLEVDLSLVFAVLSRDILMLRPEPKNLAVTLE